MKNGETLMALRKRDNFFKAISYPTLWRYINENKDELIELNIIQEIQVIKYTKTYILDSEKLKKRIQSAND